MEKERFYLNATSPNWQSSSGVDVQMMELNCSTNLLPTFLNLNWENSMDQTGPFESALSSIVSSPAASTGAGPTESVVIRELIGRLGSICNSSDICPQSQTYNNNSTNNSCYSTPLNSPPKLNLSMMDQQMRGTLRVPENAHQGLAPFAADPGFVERAAKYSCFGSQLELPNRLGPRVDNGKLSRVSSSRSLLPVSQMGISEMASQGDIETEMRSASDSDGKFRRLSSSSIHDEAEFNNAHEESSVSNQIMGANEMNARKRKAVPKGKLKDKYPKVSEEDDLNVKRSKSAEDMGAQKAAAKPKLEHSASQKRMDSSKPPEPPKDYIHVRARRGQATDSHSLAERVRREKISERMKFLQDLVPGCNKVTGKAVMLDEIINYVQSLQRQVEFLSMKLATVNPKLDFNMEALLSKDIHQAGYPLDSSAPAYTFGCQTPPGPIQSVDTNGSGIDCSVNSLDASLRRSLQMLQLPSIDGLGDAASSQLAHLWEDDLQNVVQMGFGQNQEPTFSSHFHGPLPTTHTKFEL